MNSSATLGRFSEPAFTKRAFTRWQRLQLRMIEWAGYLAIALICRTLRYSISWEDDTLPPNAKLHKPAIYAFWHRCVFPATWIWRDLDIAVMVSRSFDGEYIARIIQKFGFGAVRGSSSRGGGEALLGMREVIADREAVAFTIDGPRGPKYQAKPGAVRLARATGAPLMAFYVAIADPWVLNTWDQFMIPKPFSKALVRLSRIISVPRDATDAQTAEFQQQLQAALERVTAFAESNIGRVGSAEFPIAVQ